MNFAIVFPGQGSQVIGMLAALAEVHDEVRETFEQASQVLSQDLWSLSQNGPQAELDGTVNTQPLMLAAGVAVWRVWQKRRGGAPAVLAGHSLGEYSALVCAGAIEFETAVELVRARAELMQAAVAEGVGAMAAVLGMDAQRVIDLCAQAAEGQTVDAVNFNAPGQVVIAGHRPAVERAMRLAQAEGAKRVLRLPVSVPSHCALMSPAAEELAKRLVSVRIHAPTIPVIHNADVQSHVEPSTIANALTRQLNSPVRWVETVQFFAAHGATALLEFGPGKVLTGLNKRIDKTVKALCVHDPATLDQALSICEGDH